MNRARGQTRSTGPQILGQFTPEFESEITFGCGRGLLATPVLQCAKNPLVIGRICPFRVFTVWGMVPIRLHLQFAAGEAGSLEAKVYWTTGTHLQGGAAWRICSS
jgi:hypothetical protein